MRLRGAKAAPARLIVLGRVLLLLLAAGAVAASVVSGRRDDRASVAPAVRHACPMHPEVTANGPGETCPICRMDLEPVGAEGPTAPGLPANPSYDTVRRRPFGGDVRAPAWVEPDGRVAALFYRDELAAIGPAERGTFTGPTGTRAEIRPAGEPPTPWDDATARVHFVVTAKGDPAKGNVAHGDVPKGDPAKGDVAHGDVPRGEPAPRPGEMGWVRVSGRRRELSVIPNTAVLQGAAGPYVLVAAAGGHALEKRPVEIGRVFGGQTFVVAGLRPHEPVLVRSTFFADAERRLAHGPGEVMP